MKKNLISDFDAYHIHFKNIISTITFTKLLINFQCNEYSAAFIRQNSVTSSIYLYRLLLDSKTNIEE